MKKSKLFAFFAGFGLIASLLSGCSNDENTPSSEQPVTWAENHSLILFLHGDNNLADCMDINQNRLLQAFYDVPEDGRVFLFYDRGTYTRLTELYIDDGMVKQRLMEQYSLEECSVDPDFMKGVLERIYAEAPETKSWGLVLSSHGGGWVPSDIYYQYINYDWYDVVPMERKPRFYGQDQQRWMEIPQLVEVLKGQHFEYILFDACFMASVEALYDLRNSADYIIASPAEVRGAGFPYDIITPYLFHADHGLTKVCQGFMDFYRTYSEVSATVSLVDCDQLAALAEVMNRVMATSDGSVDIAQIQGYECFPIHLYYDLEQYAEQLTSDATLLAELRAALQAALPYRDNTPTFISSVWKAVTIDLPRSCGLTCHVEREEFPLTHEAWLQTAWAKAIGGR